MTLDIILCSPESYNSSDMWNIQKNGIEPFITQFFLQYQKCNFTRSYGDSYVLNILTDFYKLTLKLTEMPYTFLFTLKSGLKAIHFIFAL